MLSQLYWCSCSGLCGVGSHNWEPNADDCSWWLFLSHSVQEQAAEAKQIIFSFFHPQYLAVLYGLLYANVFSHSGFESRGLMGGTKRFSVSSQTVPCFRTDRGKGSSVVFGGGYKDQGLLTEGLRNTSALSWRGVSGWRTLIAPSNKMDLHRESCTPSKIQHQHASSISLWELHFRWLKLEKFKTQNAIFLSWEGFSVDLLCFV